MVDIAGRMFLDITGFVRTRGSGARSAGMRDLWRCRDKSGAPDTRDPRLSPRPGRGVDHGAVVRVVIKLVPGTIAGTLRALVRLASARRRAFTIRDGVEQMPEALPYEDTRDSDRDDDQLIGIPAAAATATGTIRVVDDPAHTNRTRRHTWLPRPPTPAGLHFPHRRRPDHRDRLHDRPRSDSHERIRSSGNICAREATTRLITGQTVTMDGASRVIQIN